MSLLRRLDSTSEAWGEERGSPSLLSSLRFETPRAVVGLGAWSVAGKTGWESVKTMPCSKHPGGSGKGGFRFWFWLLGGWLSYRAPKAQSDPWKPGGL